MENGQKKQLLDPKEQLMVILSFSAYVDATIPVDMQEPGKISAHISSILSNLDPEQKIVWGPAIGKLRKKCSEDPLPQKLAYGFLANSALFAKFLLKTQVIPRLPQADFLPISSPLSRLLLKAETLADSAAGLEYYSRPLIYIVQGADDSEYTVIIRGPNPNSLATLKNDYDISTPVVWRHQTIQGDRNSLDIEATPETEPCISYGTYKYLNEYLSLVPPADFCGAAKNIVDFLKEEIYRRKEQEKATTVNFTGHSMGGLFASTMALWFQEEMEKEGLTAKKEVDIRAYSFGAPAPGNEKFAGYSHRLLKKKCTNYANELDVTVYQWVRRDLKDTVLHLYSKAEIVPDPLVIEYLNIITENMHADWYARLKNEKQILSAVRPAKSYVEEAAYQHLYPYVFALERKNQTEELWSYITQIIDSLYYSWSLFYLFL